MPEPLDEAELRLEEEDPCAERMLIGLIAPPSNKTSSPRHGYAEPFIVNLAEGLEELGHKTAVYTETKSSSRPTARSLFAEDRSLAGSEMMSNLRESNYTAWAVRDASRSCDVIHVNSCFGLPHSRFVDNPFVFTIHDGYDPFLSEFYSFYPNVHYVSVSAFQRQQETMPHVDSIHYGVDLSHYRCDNGTRSYLTFLDAIAPLKGAHLAIAVAKKAGIPLKMAGEVESAFLDYFNDEIKPRVDGKEIEYLGEADPRSRHDLLQHSLALIIPGQSETGFGFVAIEAIACGTPVLALAGGWIGEIIQEGVTGHICHSVQELADRAREVQSRFAASNVRRHAEEHFSREHMVDQYAQLYSDILRISVPEKVQRGSSRLAFRRKVVLCIDDDAQGLRIRKLFLEAQGYDVLTAANGTAGLQLLRRRRVDIVLLDFGMPEMDGTAVATEIRKSWLHLPVIVLTGHSESDLPQRLIHLTNGVVSKGSAPDELLSRLRELTKAKAFVS